MKDLQYELIEAIVKKKISIFILLIHLTGTAHINNISENIRVG